MQLPSPEQARAVAGGLQPHSVGGYYPWTPVGRGLTGRFEVHNLQTGQALYYDNRVVQTNAAHACNYATVLQLGWVTHYPSPGFTLGPIPPNGPPIGTQGSYALRAEEAGQIDLKPEVD